MPKLFNQTLVDETAEFIAAELKVLLDRKRYDSHMSQRIAESCPAYHRGLTNSERVLATLKALHLVGPDLIGDLTSMTRDQTFEERWTDDEEEEIERELAINPAMPTTDAAPPALKLV
jgi:hypothetical protein